MNELLISIGMYSLGSLFGIFILMMVYKEFRRVQYNNFLKHLRTFMLDVDDYTEDKLSWFVTITLNNDVFPGIPYKIKHFTNPIYSIPDSEYTDKFKEWCKTHKCL